MKKVSLWEMNLYAICFNDKCTIITNVIVTSVHFMTNVPLQQMNLYDKCTFITNVFMTSVHFMTNVSLWQIFLW